MFFTEKTLINKQNPIAFLSFKKLIYDRKLSFKKWRRLWFSKAIKSTQYKQIITQINWVYKIVYTWQVIYIKVENSMLIKYLQMGLSP